MEIIKKNQITYDNFEVVDTDNNFVIGLTNNDFTKKLYNSNGTEVSASIIVTITELGNGLYRASFTPNLVGNWTLGIYNTTYFPYGKANDYQVFENNLDNLATSVQIENLEVLVTRILGLTQENFRIINPVYNVNHLMTSATIKIYNNASDCTNDLNALATYSVIATYNGDNELTSYKVIKN